MHQGKHIQENGKAHSKERENMSETTGKLRRGKTTEGGSEQLRVK